MIEVVMLNSIASILTRHSAGRALDHRRRSGASTTHTRRRCAGHERGISSCSFRNLYLGHEIFGRGEINFVTP